MTKQEKIWDGIKTYVGECLSVSGCLESGCMKAEREAIELQEGITDSIINYLHSQGVVIRVDRELPLITPQEVEEHDTKWSSSNFVDSLQEFGKKKQRDMLNDGYVAIEPLIKEERWNGINQ